MWGSGNDWYTWAKEQLLGVMASDDPRYRVEVQLMMCVATDSEMMLMAERGLPIVYFASEYEPRSWSWLI